MIALLGLALRQPRATSLVDFQSPNKTPASADPSRRLSSPRSCSHITSILNPTVIAYWGPGDLYTWLVTGEESGGAYFSMLAIVPPQGGPPPPTHSQRGRNVLCVLDGTPTFRLDAEIVIAGRGDFVNVPKGVLHNFRNLSDDPMRMILTFTPAGIERFFEETLERAYDLTQDCPANLAEVGARYAEAGPGTETELFPDA